MAHTHDILAGLVKRVKCKPGWTFRLRRSDDDVYPKLVITVPGYNSVSAPSIDAVLAAADALDEALAEGGTIVSPHVGEAIGHLRIAVGGVSLMTVSHFFPVPEATYNEATWRRWIFECCRGVENHEMGEWFRDGDERPFSPLHGPGEDPYTVHEFRPVADMLTTQDGSMREPYKG
jgi:hypothetical protein